jgi:hypothetical protein
MVHSKNKDFEDVPGFDIDSPLPITDEDIFNDLNGAKLPPRIRKPPHVHGTTPSPPSKKITRKNTSKKKTGPLANSARTNQCKSNSHNKKRGRKKSSLPKSSTAPINPTPVLFPVSVAPYVPTGNPTLPNGTFVDCLLMFICRAYRSFILI